MTEKITHIGAAGTRQQARKVSAQRITTETLAEADRYWRACARKISSSSDEEFGLAFAQLARDVGFSLWCTLLGAENEAAQPPPSA